MKTVLEICREIADIAGVERPDDLWGNNHQWLALILQELNSHLNYNWQELIKQYEITPYRCEEKLWKDIIINEDYLCLSHNTIYVRDNENRVIGAIPYEKWKDNQNYKSKEITFILNNDGIRIIDFKKGVKILFQYKSKSIVWDFNSFEEKSIITANTDVPIFDEYLIKLGVLWRWEKLHNQDYSESYNEYQRELKKRLGDNLQ